MAPPPGATLSARAVLLAVVGAFVRGEPVPRGLEAADWEGVLRRAQEERLAPVLYAVLRDACLGAPILDRLRAAWLAGQRQHLLGSGQLRGLLSAFGAEGVGVIPLRGPALATRLYGDPGLRLFTDLDLLVRSADRSRAIELLTGLGYRHLDEGRPLEFELAYGHAASFGAPEGQPEALPIDLHWALVDAPGVGRSSAVDLGEVWDRAVEESAGGARAERALALSSEDLLICLAGHWAVHHALSGLVWALDLALLLRREAGRLDWQAVGARAARWRLAGAVAFALGEVRRALGVSVPGAAVEPRGPRGAALRWLRRRRDERFGRLDHLVPLLLMDRGSDLLRASVRDALPPAGWVRARYGQVSTLRAYLTHYGRAGQVCARAARAALGR